MTKTRTTWKTNTLGGRLRSAIDRQPPEGKSRGVGLLIKKLQEREAPGANYPSINSYLENRVEPPLAFLRAVADALGVRFTWLAVGQGAETEEAEQARSADESRARSRLDFYDRIKGAVPSLDKLGINVPAAFLEYMLKNVEARDQAGFQFDLDGSEWEELALSVWEYLMAPFDGWSAVLGGVVPLDPRTFGTYAMAALHALTLAVELAVPPGLSSDDIKRWKPLPQMDEDHE